MKTKVTEIQEEEEEEETRDEKRNRETIHSSENALYDIEMRYISPALTKIYQIYTLKNNYDVSYEL